MRTKTVTILRPESRRGQITESFPRRHGRIARNHPVFGRPVSLVQRKGNPCDSLQGSELSIRDLHSKHRENGQDCPDPVHLLLQAFQNKVEISEPIFVSRPGVMSALGPSGDVALSTLLAYRSPLNSETPLHTPATVLTEESFSYNIQNSLRRKTMVLEILM